MREAIRSLEKNNCGLTDHITSTSTLPPKIEVSSLLYPTGLVADGKDPLSILGGSAVSYILRSEYHSSECSFIRGTYFMWQSRLVGFLNSRCFSILWPVRA